MNVPYVKQIDKLDGSIMNPITKHKPYVSPFPNRRVRRMRDGKKSHGKTILWNLGKGKFVKYVTRLQHIPAHYNPHTRKWYSARTIQHYDEV